MLKILAGRVGKNADGVVGTISTARDRRPCIKMGPGVDRCGNRSFYWRIVTKRTGPRRWVRQHAINPLKRLDDRPSGLWRAVGILWVIRHASAGGKKRPPDRRSPAAAGVDDVRGRVVRPIAMKNKRHCGAARRDCHALVILTNRKSCQKIQPRKKTFAADINNQQSGR